MKVKSGKQIRMKGNDKSSVYSQDNETYKILKSPSKRKGTKRKQKTPKDEESSHKLAKLNIVKEKTKRREFLMEKHGKGNFEKKSG